MRNVMKYLGIMSVSLACAGPLFATRRTAVCRCHCRTAECSYCEGPSVDEKGEPIIGAKCHCGRYDKRYDYRFGR